MKLLLLLLLSMLPLRLRAQAAAPLEWVRNPQYQLQYRVPADWNKLRQATDTTLALTHMSPDQNMMLFIGKLRGAAANMTPEQALFHLTEKFGVPINKQYATAYNGIRFLETTGTGSMDGRALRYDALAAHHRGHVLLIYILATPDAFMNHEPLMQEILHSMAPYKGR
ncbi:hypothetical protein SAMN02745146_1735 [Hymenobacter daecheongensis DSM 21074]|uniref:Uncharacterized protein n=1 Tax=Hymenobacter daecheongensis DSM 21074 TaxID=1121955 RepID=A0A1M6EM91_9BACT|nr:hypothetical protein [Hymenobacter daecheongensis]SHI86398.1 hypothetical protein SAMN02745146_1735 [Hymenobacter daecheongensis DSM 21074]